MIIYLMQHTVNIDSNKRLIFQERWLPKLPNSRVDNVHKAEFGLPYNYGPLYVIFIAEHGSLTASTVGSRKSNPEKKISVRDMRNSRVGGI
jgi:hypothetical protein